MHHKLDCRLRDALMSPLLSAALAARDHAHAPYSRFRVGAALEDSAGHIHTGCNIENSTYGLTICADTETLTPPCGACRQILWEFCGDIEIILVNPRGKTETLRVKDLLP